MPQQFCEHCGGPIVRAQRPTRRYCSDSCRQHAYRERHSPRYLSEVAQLRARIAELERQAMKERAR